jgi:hypothetical protein
MKTAGSIAVLIAALLLASHAPAQDKNDSGRGRAVITVLSKHSEVSPTIAQADVSAKVNGKDAAVTGWAPFKGADDALELVVLIDGGARNLGRQFEEIQEFVAGLGPNTKISIGYMENGIARLVAPPTADRRQVASELHLPAGPFSNPYFALSDLAHKWPAQDHKARREVVMFSDGIDLNSPRFDPDDPYVQTAIHDVVRAGLVVYTIYWRSRPEGGEMSPLVSGGQSLMGEVTDATGGYSYWQGGGNPVSFQPFFKDITHRLASQYALDFTTRLDHKPTIDPFKIKLEGLNLQISAPQQVYVVSAGGQ